MQSDIGARIVLNYQFLRADALNTQVKIADDGVILKWYFTRDISLRDGATGAVKITNFGLVDNKNLYRPVHIKFSHGIWAVKTVAAGSDAYIQIGIG